MAKKNTYKVIDRITGEELIFFSLYDAEVEAEARTSIHTFGIKDEKFPIKPIPAVLHKTGNNFIIELNHA